MAQFSSSKDVEAAVTAIIAQFDGKETEENWDSRDKALTKLRSILKGNAVHWEGFTSHLKELIELTLRSAGSLRTALALTACHTTTDFCVLGTALDPHSDLILKSLLKLTAQTKKILAQAACSALIALLKVVSYQLKNIQTLGSMSTDKNIAVRTYSATLMKALVLATLEQDPHGHAHLEKSGGLEALEKYLSRSLADAGSEVRSTSREILEVLQGHWPTRVESLLESLNPVTRKAIMNALKKSEKSGQRQCDFANHIEMRRQNSSNPVEKSQAYAISPAKPVPMIIQPEATPHEAAMDTEENQKVTEKEEEEDATSLLLSQPVSQDQSPLRPMTSNNLQYNVPKHHYLDPNISSILDTSVIDSGTNLDDVSFHGLAEESFMFDHSNQELLASVPASLRASQHATPMKTKSIETVHSPSQTPTQSNTKVGGLVGDQMDDMEDEINTEIAQTIHLKDYTPNQICNMLSSQPSSSRSVLDSLFLQLVKSLRFDELDNEEFETNMLLVNEFLKQSPVLPQGWEQQLMEAALFGRSMGISERSGCSDIVLHTLIDTLDRDQYFELLFRSISLSSPKDAKYDIKSIAIRYVGELVRRKFTITSSCRHGDDLMTMCCEMMSSATPEERKSATFCLSDMANAWKEEFWDRVGPLLTPPQVKLVEVYTLKRR